MKNTLETIEIQCYSAINQADSWFDSIELNEKKSKIFQIVNIL